MRRIAGYAIALLCTTTLLTGCTDEDFDEILLLLEAFAQGPSSAAADTAEARRAEQLKTEALQETDPERQLALLDDAIRLREWDPELRALRVAVLRARGATTEDIRSDGNVIDQVTACPDGPGECDRKTREMVLDSFRSMMDTYDDGGEDDRRLRASYCELVTTYGGMYGSSLTGSAYLDSTQAREVCSEQS
jgi:hypothetical protein